jgi:hypothetical protein
MSIDHVSKVEILGDLTKFLDSLSLDKSIVDYYKKMKGNTQFLKKRVNNLIRRIKQVARQSEAKIKLINEKCKVLDVEKAKLSLNSEMEKIAKRADTLVEKSLIAVYNPNYEGGDPELVKELEKQMNMEPQVEARKALLDPDVKGLVQSIIKAHTKQLFMTKQDLEVAEKVQRVIASYIAHETGKVSYKHFEEYMKTGSISFNKLQFKNIGQEQQFMKLAKRMIHEFEQSPTISKQCKIALTQVIRTKKEEKIKAQIEKEKEKIEKYNKLQEKKRLERKERRAKLNGEDRLRATMQQENRERVVQNEIGNTKRLHVQQENKSRERVEQDGNGKTKRLHAQQSDIESREIVEEFENMQIEAEAKVRAGKLNQSAKQMFKEIEEQCDDNVSVKSGKSGKSKRSKRSDKIRRCGKTEFIKLPNPNMVDVIDGKAIDKNGKVIPMYILQKVTSD